MSNELDIAVAERVMGWQRQDGYNYWMSFPAGETFNLHALIAKWKPSTDIAFAMRVEDRIAELGLQSPYYGALVNIVAASITDRVFHLFDVVHATPEQRCRAALQAFSAEVNTR